MNCLRFSCLYGYLINLWGKGKISAFVIMPILLMLIIFCKQTDLTQRLKFKLKLVIINRSFLLDINQSNTTYKLMNLNRNFNFPCL